MSIGVCLAVGLLIGLVASRTTFTSGYGRLLDGAIGVGGALVACVIFSQLGWLPEGLIAAVPIVAFVGALAALMLMRRIHRVMSNER